MLDSPPRVAAGSHTCQPLSQTTADRARIHHCRRKVAAMIIRIVFFLLLGLLLVGANVWFVIAVKSAFFDRQMPKQIAPFRVIGREDKDGTLGLAMAHQLQARLALLRSELEEARLLEAEKSPPPSTEGKKISILSSVSLRQVDFSDRVFTPLDLPVNIGGVELGGILARIHRFLTAPRAMGFVVEFQPNEAIILGNFNMEGEPPIYARTRPTADDIVTAIAYAISQRKMATSIEHVKALDLQEFRKLITTLKEVPRLNAKVRSERATREDFQALLAPLRELVETIPRWREIVHLTAEIAENAEETDYAVTLYRQEMALLDPDSAKAAEISQRIARLEKPLQVAAAEPRARPLDQGTMIKQLRDSSWGQALLNNLGITPQTAADLTASPTIAVLGPLPQAGLLPPERGEVLREAIRGPDYETQYTDDLVRLVQLVAPSARFSFTTIDSIAPGSYTEPQITEALEALLKASPDILLVTVGPLSGPAFHRIFHQARQQGTLVIEPAYSPPPAGEQIPLSVSPESLMVGALGADQKIAQPLAAGVDPQQVYWVPGQDLPTLSSRGRIVPKTGHAYAAAVAAGLLWQFKYAAPAISPGEMAQVLHRTSRKVQEHLPAIDLPAALAEVKKLRAGPTIRRVQEVAKEIPDNDPLGLDSELEISEQGTISRIQVGVDIDHTYIGDLVVALMPPQGQSIILHNREGGSIDNISRIYSAELEPLIGREAQGKWTLRVSDHSHQDKGSLIRWTLEVGLAQ